MKRSKSIYNFNHIDKNLSKSETSELKALYRYHYCFRQTYKYFKKVDLACNISSAALVATGTIVGGSTLNPIFLGSMSGAGLILKTFSEAKNFKRKVEICKFAYTSYKKKY